MHLAYFSKKFQHYALDFCTFGRNPQLVGRFLKVLDENSIDKVNLFLFLGMVAAEIETSEITSFFYNNSFRFAGGGVNPPLNFPPPMRTPLSEHIVCPASRQL